MLCYRIHLNRHNINRMLSNDVLREVYFRRFVIVFDKLPNQGYKAVALIYRIRRDELRLYGIFQFAEVANKSGVRL